MPKHKNRHRSQQSQRHNMPSGQSQSSAPPVVPLADTTATSVPNEPSLEVKVAAVHDAALQHATEEDLNAAATSSPVENHDLGDLLRKAHEVLALLESQRQRLSNELSALEGRQKRLGDGEARAEQRDREQSELQKEFNSRQTELEKNEQACKLERQRLLDWDESLKRRELNAEAGFAAERRQSLELLEKEAAVLRQELSSARQRRSEEEKEHHARLAKAQLAWTQEQDADRQKLSAELRHRREEFEATLQVAARSQADQIAQERQTLEAEKLALRDEQKKLSRAVMNLKDDRELIEEKRADLDRLIDQRAAAERERHEYELKALEQRLESARADRLRLDERLRRREEADLRFGNRTPEEIHAELDAIRKERDALHLKLARRPDEQALSRLQELEKAQEQWMDERFRLQQENLALKRKLSQFEMAVTELESLRDHRDVLQSRVNLAHQQIGELRTEIDTRIKTASERSPFPACQQMDQDSVLQSPVLVEDKKIDLQAFVAQLRQRMAFDPDTNKRLYYSERDVRCFLGGLAMSKLLLLQGVSGTGKTSLPIAFARAIGAEWKLVPVQAGWRDRQDLLGHFNEFDHRFDETEFLKALYRAQCPRCQERPFLLVLDEMNLSHPEQYGADLLSALEQDLQHQRLHLRPAAIPGAPKLLVDGSALRIPANVWFVGTANHDETTRDFADKTYDRAHVMELPRHRETFELEEQQSPAPLALSALQSAFDRARRDHEEQAQRAYEFIETNLADPLAQRFRIGWGNRLDRQLRDFVPVVIAAGGSLGEATDHVVATKLLRKLRDRHDTRREDVQDLRDSLSKAWSSLVGKSKGAPQRSLEILDAELRRLGAEELEEA
jgi:hypothetical protein